MIIKKSKLSKFIKLPNIFDEANLVFTEGKRHLPFSIKRVYYILNMKKGSLRGFHAHKKCQQVIFCIQGRIKLVLDNGSNREEFIIKQPDQGIFLDKMIWHEMSDFVKGTILLVLASDYYKEKDYIRDYQKFLRQVRKELRDDTNE